MLKEFKKVNIMPGLMFKTRNGGQFKLGVNPNYSKIKTVLVEKYGGFLLLQDYDEDLKFTCDSVENRDYDIVQVYRPLKARYSFSFIRQDHELIWERDETVYLSRKEIAEKFNVPVEKLVIIGDEGYAKTY